MAFQELAVLQSPNQGLSYGEKTNPSNEVLREGSEYTYLLCMALSHFQDPKVIVGLCVVVI